MPRQSCFTSHRPRFVSNSTTPASRHLSADVTGESLHLSIPCGVDRQFPVYPLRSRQDLQHACHSSWWTWQTIIEQITTCQRAMPQTLVPPEAQVVGYQDHPPCQRLQRGQTLIFTYSIPHTESGEKRPRNLVGSTYPQIPQGPRMSHLRGVACRHRPLDR